MNIILNSDLSKVKLSMLFKKILRINFILGCIVVLLSGRRALQIVTLFAILAFFGLLIKKYKNKSLHVSPYKLLFLCVFVLFFYQMINKALGINNLLGSVYSTILDAFDPTNHSGTIRQTQFGILLGEWIKKPLLGWGLNAYVHNYTRSEITKWSYEYVYIAFLFQTGVIGSSVLFTYIFFILKKIYGKYKKYKDSGYGIYFISTFIGFICFLVAGATNPLAVSLWAWLITLICFNINIDFNESTVSDQ